MVCWNMPVHVVYGAKEVQYQMRLLLAYKLRTFWKSLIPLSMNLSRISSVTNCASSSMPLACRASEKSGHWWAVWPTEMQRIIPVRMLPYSSQLQMKFYVNPASHPRHSPRPLSTPACAQSTLFLAVSGAIGLLERRRDTITVGIGINASSPYLLISRLHLLTKQWLAVLQWAKVKCLSINSQANKTYCNGSPVPRFDLVIL